MSSKKSTKLRGASKPIDPRRAPGRPVRKGPDPFALTLIGVSIVVVVVLVFLLANNGTPQTATTANTPGGPTVTPNPTQLEVTFATRTAGLARISLGDAKAQYDAHTSTFIDARAATATDPQLSYDAGHIKGAVDIPYTNPSAELAKLSKSGSYITYCQ